MTTIPTAGTSPAELPGSQLTIGLTQCRHCTVPTDGTDVCSYCANYTPPATVAQRLDVAVNRVHLLRHDLNNEVEALSTDAPLFSVTDLVAALRHLLTAARLIDQAGRRLYLAETAQ